MEVRVERGIGYRLVGGWEGVEPANAFLRHLETRAFATATVRAYAYDLLNFARFVIERGLDLADIVPTDVFDWLDWQRPPRTSGGTVIELASRSGAAPASMNRRVAAVRAFFGHQVIVGARTDNPCLRRAAAQGCGRRRADLSATWDPGDLVVAAVWSARFAGSPSPSTRPTSRPSSPISPHIGTGRSCWLWSWAGCG